MDKMKLQPVGAEQIEEAMGLARRVDETLVGEKNISVFFAALTIMIDAIDGLVSSVEDEELRDHTLKQLHNFVSATMTAYVEGKLPAEGSDNND